MTVRSPRNAFMNVPKVVWLDDDVMVGNRNLIVLSSSTRVPREQRKVTDPFVNNQCSVFEETLTITADDSHPKNSIGQRLFHGKPEKPSWPSLCICCYCSFTLYWLMLSCTINYLHGSNHISQPSVSSNWQTSEMNDYDVKKERMVNGLDETAEVRQCQRTWSSVDPSTQ